MVSFFNGALIALEFDLVRTFKPRSMVFFYANPGWLLISEIGLFLFSDHNNKDRIIYRIDDSVVLVYVISMKGHYGDK